MSITSVGVFSICRATVINIQDAFHFPFIYNSCPCTIHQELNHNHDNTLVFLLIKERLLRFEATFPSLVILMILVVGYKHAIHQENACSFLYPYI